jgi:hypothetical protein
VIQVLEYIKSQKQGVSRQNIVENCQISDGELEKLVNQTNFEKYLRIFENSSNNLEIMDEAYLYDILDGLLVLINHSLSHEKVISFKKLIQVNDGILKSSDFQEQETKFALLHISK